jgi:hypothetical protein
VIGEPRNDVECLGEATRIARTLVAQHDPIVMELAAQYPTFRAFVSALRGKPQHDDQLDMRERPRVKTCTPSQRLQLDNPAPNCFERAVLGMVLGELKRPDVVWQLASNPARTHTFLSANGRTVVLDPVDRRAARAMAESTIALTQPETTPISPDQAIDWVSELAQGGAPRNAGSAHNVERDIARTRAVIQRVIEGAPPTAADIDAVGRMLALAVLGAQDYSPRAVVVVEVTARALSELLDQRLAAHAAQRARNASLALGPFRFEAPQWFAQDAAAVGKTGLDLGALIARAELEAHGVPAGAIGLAEANFQSEGRTLGPLAHPPDLSSYASTYAAPKRAA